MLLGLRGHSLAGIWLTSLAYLLLGISELSARLVTALASGLSYSCFGLLQRATLILLVGIASATLAWLRRRPAWSIACLVGTMLPTLTFVQTGIVMFEPHRSIVRLADVILRELRPGDQIIIEGPYENFASANFYTGQRARVLHGLFGDLEFGSRYPEAQGTFLEEEEFAELWRGAGRVYLLSDSPNRLARLQALGSEPAVLGRSGKNWLFTNRKG